MDPIMLFIFISVVFLLIFWLMIKKILALLDAANIVDWQHRWVNRADGFVRLFCTYYHRLPKNYIPLPESGAAIIVANHISGLDPLLLIVASKRPIRFLIAREEYNRVGLQWLFKGGGCIPVDRYTNPEKALRQAMVALENGEVIAIFPQGGIQWPITEDNPFKIKGGAVRLAQRKKVALFPVIVNGVSMKGYTLLAVLKRSRASLDFGEIMKCESVSYAECLQTLSEKLNRVS